MSILDADRSTPEQDKGKVRVNFVMSPELAEVLEELAVRNHTSKSEVIRKAISLMTVVSEARDRKERVGLFGSDRQLLTEIVGV